MESAILVIDSGSGGDYTAKEIHRALPNENIIVFLDKLNAPYGNKNKKQLTKIFLNNLEIILNNYDIKLIVLACYTLSSVIPETIIKNASVPIIKIMPEIECALNTKKETLVLCTKATKKYNKAIIKYKFNKLVLVKSLPHLAKLIDDKNMQEIKIYLCKKLKQFRKNNIENVILGCTHYNLVKDEINYALASKMLFFYTGINTLVFNIQQILKAVGEKKRGKKPGEILVINSLIKFIK